MLLGTGIWTTQDPSFNRLSKRVPLWKVRRTLGDFLHFSAPQHVLLRFVVRGNLLDGLVAPPFPLLLQTPLLPAIPHTSFLLLPTQSSAVTPSHSACHPSDTCQSAYSSGHPLDRSPTAASASGLLRTPLLPLGAPTPF
ncbi:hypothetical protein PGT21_013416 [Puccinia graminis f. sp. tritici]|uniref:Uncharacterized protein n=1 Tax=Puccinia graminis f. sp. tritici TaxID=56615 RepID=A0A5B0QAP8_PUCGR|nr:hypothetical protein PGT21_013416 [Puccinia graminis f. sp. tritici]